MFVRDAPRLATTPAAPRRLTESRALRERRLFARYRGRGDLAARDELVKRFLPLATRLARRYHRGVEPLEDLVQVASVGLLNAIDRFDPGRGTAFSSFAVPTIAGELKRYFRDTGWALHVPRGMQERVMTVNQAIGRLSRTLGRSPTAAEIANETGMDLEVVLEALEAAIAYDAVSLDTPRTSDEDDGDTYADTMGVIDDRFELIENTSEIGPTMPALPVRDRLVLKLRFEQDLTQLEIAERIGVSQMHVSRLIRRALKRLRTVADAQ